jgi:hypothetical protein
MRVVGYEIPDEDLSYAEKRMTANWICRRSLQIAFLTTALTCSSTQLSWSSSQDDTPDDTDAPAPLIINDVELLRIKRGLSFVPDGGRLDGVLSWEITEIDRVCHLTNDEKQKLRLAGQGDAKRLLDRAHALEAALQSATGQPQIDKVVREWDSLKLILTSGIFEEGSLFSKTRRQILTPEQMVKLETAMADTSSVWMKDLQEAQALASRLDRPVLIHFSLKRCPPARQIERVMESPMVLRVLRRKFALVSIDIEQNLALARTYNVATIPCELVLNTKGDELCRSEGLKDDLELLHALHFVKNETGQKREVVPPAK